MLFGKVVIALSSDIAAKNPYLKKQFLGECGKRQ